MNDLHAESVRPRNHAARPSLTNREIEILEVVSKGYRNKEIAARLADKSADRSEAAFDQAKADAIAGYLNIVERADNLEGVLNRTEPGRWALFCERAGCL